MALDYQDHDMWKYRFIYEKDHDSLPHLQDGGYYNNLNRFEFVVPKADIELLTSKVIEHSKKLTEFHK